ncbi:MAG: hypothetical protein EBT95_11365 [Verrucomicrobia bacterium]|nr:hypothetical protein [Verrucomicrobiota bacterium]
MRFMMRALIFAPFILLPWVVSSAPTNTVEVGDPTIARDGDWYYVFSSGVGASIRRSKDLVNWELLPPVFPGAVPNWVREKIPSVTRIVWAPDILRFQNKYWCYYSYSTGVGSQRSVIGLATAETWGNVEGPGLGSGVHAEQRSLQCNRSGDGAG